MFYLFILPGALFPSLKIHVGNWFCVYHAQFQKIVKVQLIFDGI